MGEGITVKSEDELAVGKPIFIFKRDVTQIPCFRSSFICGICSGLVGGLACFLVTSKTLMSTHVAFASIWVGVFCYWIPCRFKYESTALAIQEMKGRNKTRYQETTENKSQ